MEDARIESTTRGCETPDTEDKSEGRFSFYDYVSEKVYPAHLTKKEEREEEKQALRKRSKFFMGIMRYFPSRAAQRPEDKLTRKSEPLEVYCHCRLPEE